MDSYDLRFESIIPETQFEDIGIDDGDFISDKVEDEVIVIASDDDMANVAPVRERKDVVLLESQKDTVFLLGREEPNFVVLDGDIDDADCSNCFFAMAHMLLTVLVDTLNCAARPPGHRDEKRKRNKAECERIVEKIMKTKMEKKGE
ncbi:unnamed protein product [Cuscuta campestris]|uniref:Uncharacterized protein n=1 Tax=Cuscuta campestris TaxID=132261 RepID=A0A484KFC5_9ASTE|nr:unnamed protein product [Cuscuta campestris]